MTVILAALDAAPTARRVLETAVAVGELMNASVAAVHVREGPVDVPAALAAEYKLPLRILAPPLERSLLDAVSDPQACAGVFGARLTAVSQQPLGRTALHVLERVTKPIVVVPQTPHTAPRQVRQLHRLLVPLEGTDRSARPVADSLTSLLHADVELLVLHVYTPATVPPMLDRPARDQSLWGEEFVARFLPEASSIALRAGPVGDRVIEAVQETDADLVVLSWAQNMSPGHATVIRDVLTRVPVPVLLLPAAESPTVARGEDAARRANSN